MRIHRITLRNFRGVTQAEVRLAEQGVTIIEGANEVGKTSLAEAVDLILDYRDDSNHRSVKAVQPVGRDVGAEVEVELSSGPYRFVYAKRWHRQRQTTLQVLEPRREQLTGREAHDRVNAILDETLDRPLWRALCVEQESRLSQPGFDVVSLSRALDLAAEGRRTDPRGDDLWERISVEHDRYWTSTGLANKDRTRLAGRVDEARARVSELEGRLGDLEADTEEATRLVRAATELAATQAACEDAEVELTERSETVAELRSQARHLAAQRDAAEAVHTGAQLQAERRGDLVAAVRSAAASLAARQADVAQAEPLRAITEARHRAAQQALCQARSARHRAEIDHLRAIGDRDFRRQLIELEQLTERRDRVVVAQRQLNEAEREIESIRVDDDLVVRIELAHLELAKAQAAADSGAAVVTTTALQPLDVAVDGRLRTLVAGATDERSVTAPLELVVPGVVQVKIRPGAEAQVLAERLREATEELAALCESGAVADLDQARALAARRAEALRSRATTSTTIRQDLRDLTVDALSQKIERLGQRAADYTAARPAQPPLPPDFDTAQAHANATEAALGSAQAELERRELAAEEAASAVNEAAVGDAGLEALLAQARSALTQAEEVLRSARAECPDDALEASLAEARSRLEQTVADLARADEQLAAEDPAGLDELLSNARAAKARVLQRLQDNQERQRELRIRLDLLGERGMAGELDEAKTDLEHLQREHQSLESRAEAARLLHEVFAARRTEAHTRYVAPFRQRIEQLGRLVFGNSLEVELDAELRVARRTLEGVTVDFDQLSAGAQEQLGIISRLACAAIVAGDGGAPVVFDDALGWSDPRRLERMGAALSVAGRDCQVIVLTCTPGRYANVGTAEVLTLPGRVA